MTTTKYILNEFIINLDNLVITSKVLKTVLCVTFIIRVKSAISMTK